MIDGNLEPNVNNINDKTEKVFPSSVERVLDFVGELVVYIVYSEIMLLIPLGIAAWLIISFGVFWLILPLAIIALLLLFGGVFGRVLGWLPNKRLLDK